MTIPDYLRLNGLFGADPAVRSITNGRPVRLPSQVPSDTVPSCFSHDLRPPSHLRFALALLVLTLGCGRDRVFTEMSDSTFVRTMVALRQLPVGAGIDVASRNQKVDSILRTFGVKAAQIESTAVRLSNDPVRASDIWRAIENAPRVGPPPSEKKNGA